MNKITIEQIAEAKENPTFKGLSDDLKDPKVFKRIEKKLEKVMLSDHSHNNVKAFIKCKRCQDKFKKKRAMIKELGFTSIFQYQTWKKVMDIVINKKEIELYVRESK